MKKLNVMDLFTGIATFHHAASKLGVFNTIVASEIDTYKIDFINQNTPLENFGSVCDIGVSAANHPYYQQCLVEDTVPCESNKYGFSSVTLEDFFEGVMEFPDVIIGGFPCKNVSTANTVTGFGIKGGQSSLVEEQLRLIEDLEPRYVVFENVSALCRKGLDRILTRLMNIGYQLEFETISATSFGFPQYRHRLFIVGYLPAIETVNPQLRIFDVVRAKGSRFPTWKLPLLSEKDIDIYLIENAVVAEPKSIYKRTKRLNALGDAVVVDIAEAILSAIGQREGLIEVDKSVSLSELDTLYFNSKNDSWHSTPDFRSEKVNNKMPEQGVLDPEKRLIHYSKQRCEVLNPSKVRYRHQGLYSTLCSRDGNNNISTRSRIHRPGSLGGVVGDLIKATGLMTGGLSPEFAERLMGFPIGYTALKDRPF